MKSKDEIFNNKAVRHLKVGKVNGSDVFYELDLVDIEKELYNE